MRAARYYGPGDVRIEEVAEPEAGPGQVKIQVAYNGICGSDLNEYYYAAPMMIPVAEPHPTTGVVAPVVLGHECGGVVVAVGDGVEDVEIGALVAVEPIKRCGVCPQCVAGRYNLCDAMAFNGFSTGQGGLAQYTVVDREMVHPLPAGSSPMQAALIEPLAVSFRAVRRAGIEGGDTVAVHGAGPIGVGAVLASRHLGADVVVTDPSKERRAIAEQLGGVTVIDPTETDPIAAILDATGGRGADASIDAAGVSASFEVALVTTAKGGRIVLVAVHHAPLQLFTPLLLQGEIDLRVSTAYCGDFPAVIDAMQAGAYPLDGWVTTIPMSSLVEDGFEQLKAGRGVKILVDPTT